MKTTSIAAAAYLYEHDAHIAVITLDPQSEGMASKNEFVAKEPLYFLYLQKRKPTSCHGEHKNVLRFSGTLEADSPASLSGCQDLGSFTSTLITGDTGCGSDTISKSELDRVYSEIARPAGITASIASLPMDLPRVPRSPPTLADRDAIATRMTIQVYKFKMLSREPRLFENSHHYSDPLRFKWSKPCKEHGELQGQWMQSPFDVIGDGAWNAGDALTLLISRASQESPMGCIIWGEKE
ncbi:hypothetical protein LTR62_005828 [Meristemomyces frigidus]|uniref:Uncharacterized protein n=1 Tax=Meristemomyces frigidus TaxID=1508187 RepID=A0AAN7TCQ3_9PEZI|nr:hypothetical protein LTR62_005828 [Meristemomyces frigidus]